jgi:lipopolysaccharide/colanic/teichoic acid biosynthesis glycosyltransferase
MDLTVAALALLVCLPVMLAVAIAIRLDSRGPTLFRQKRMGRDGKEFVLLKFRSMYASSVPGKCVTVNGDLRITRVGVFLRCFKLDELPQLWNVVKGDLSLVGPRPKLAHLEPLLMPFRPGITGAATLVFRREESLLASVPEDNLVAFYHTFVKPSKAQMDQDYMQGATLLSDLRILFETATGWMNKSDHPVLDDIKWEASRICQKSARFAPHRNSIERTRVYEQPKASDFSGVSRSLASH